MARRDVARLIISNNAIDRRVALLRTDNDLVSSRRTANTARTSGTKWHLLDDASRAKKSDGKTNSMTVSSTSASS